MAPRINLLSRLRQDDGGWAGKPIHRVYLVILILSGLLGAGAAAELLARRSTKTRSE